MLTFDTYTSAAPHDSKSWATSDRGWMHRGDGACIGYYLSYGDRPGRPAFVRASVYDRPTTRTGWVGEPTALASQDCVTVDEAVAWMQEQHTRRSTA